MEVDARHEELLALGRRLFSQYSYDELSIASIAEKAGISKGLIYHYFPTKRDFYVETVRASAKQLLGLLKGQPTDAPLERLRRGIEAYLRYVDEYSSAYLSLLNGGIGVDPEVSRIVESVRNQVVDQILEALGISEPSSLQEMALYGWVHMVEGASQAWLREKAVSREQLQSVLSRQLVFIVSTQDGFAGLTRALLAKVAALFDPRVAAKAGA